MAMTKGFVASFAIALVTTAVALKVQHLYPGLPPMHQDQAVRPRNYDRIVYSPFINSTATGRDHGFAMGTRSPKEQILLYTALYETPSLWTGYAEKEFTYPAKGHHLRVNITRMYLIDKARNGTGAFVRLKSGGIGHPNVTFVFQSQKNQPIYFNLAVFGYPLQGLGV